MNSTSDNFDNKPSKDLSGYAYYSVGLSLAVLLLIAFFTLISYYCTRRYAQSPHGSSAEVGLEEGMLNSYPVLLYSEAKLNNADSCCPICLADYKDTDSLRLLPDCHHLFHRYCVDRWLCLNSSCPVCRNSPLPTPLSTPLADVQQQVIEY